MMCYECLQSLNNPPMSDSDYLLMKGDVNLGVIVVTHANGYAIYTMHAQGYEWDKDNKVWKLKEPYGGKVSKG